MRSAEGRIQPRSPFRSGRERCSGPADQPARTRTEEALVEIKVSSKHMELTPAIEEYARKKSEKFPRYFDLVQQVEVVVDRAPHGYTTEIIVDVEHHNPFVAKAEHEDLYASIDLTVDRLSRQLTDHKSKLRDNKHNSTARGEL
jgi:putative sigma-54 modulation protein